MRALNIVFLCIAALDLLFLFVLMLNEIAGCFKKKPEVNYDYDFLDDPDDDDETFLIEDVDEDEASDKFEWDKLPELSPDAMQKLYCWQYRDFAKEVLLPVAPRTVAALPPRLKADAMLLLTAYICYLCEEAPEDEKSFPMLLEMMSASKIPESMNDVDAVEHLMRDSIRCTNPHPTYYEKYLLYKATCLNKRRVLSACKALVVAVMEKLHLEPIAYEYDFYPYDKGEDK